MTPTSLATELEAVLDSFPWMDPHSHLDASHLAARGLDDILLHHMAISDLYAAGCPSGARISEDRSEQEAEAGIIEALPYLKNVQNTFISWGIRTILADLYDWHQPVTADSWQRLHHIIREHSTDPSWGKKYTRASGVRTHLHRALARARRPSQ